MKKVVLDLENLKTNHFMVLVAFENQAVLQEWSQSEIEAVLKEARSGDYEHILKTIKRYCIQPTY